MAVARLGYEIDSSGAVIAEQNLDDMAAAAKRAEVGSSGLEREFNKTMRTSNGAASGVLSLDAALGSTTKAISTTTSAATIFEAQVSGIGNEIARTAAESQIWQRELEQTRARFDPLFAASKRYEQELRDIAEAERMGAINANVAAQARDRAATAMNGGAVAVAKFGGAMQVSSAHTANLGAQLNDIGVMLAAGQNPLQLAVQQGTQINQVFAQMGGGRQALRGLAAGFLSMINPMSLATIGIIAGGAALTQWAVAAFGARDEASEFEDRLDSLSEMMEGLNSSSDMLEWSMDELTEKFGHQAEVVRGLIVNLAQYRVSIAQNELREFGDLAKIATDQFSRLSRSADLVAQEIEYLNQQDTAFSRSRIADLTKQIANEAAEMGEQFGITADEAILLSDAFAQLGAAGTTEQVNQELVDLNELMKELGIGTEMIPDELEQAIAKMSELGILSAELAETMRQVAINSSFAPGLNPNMPVSSLLPPRQRDRGCRGGGGSRVDPFERDLERLRESLRTEREVVDEWYAQQKEILANRRAMEILGIEGHNQAKLRLEQEYQERLQGINQAGLGGNLGVMSEFFGEAAGLMQSGNKKLFQIGQAAAIANAVVNGHNAAVAAWDKGMQAGGPPLAATFTALSVAKTASQIAAIKGASFGSGGGGSGSGTSATAGVTATGATAPQQTRAIISLQGGRSRFTVEEINDITRQLQEQSDDGVIIEGFTRA